MNECFFMGKIINIGKFKFILNPKVKHKSEIMMKIKLIDGNLIKAVVYDESADYVLRNNFYENIVLIQGRLRCEDKNIQIIIKSIEKIKSLERSEI